MGRLTEAQRRVLEKARAATYADYSGHGVFLYDTEMTVAVRLEKRGLVSLNPAWPMLSIARITEAGRFALDVQTEPGEPT